MSEPTFDKDGYPTEETLDRIARWEPPFAPLMVFVQRAWKCRDHAVKCVGVGFGCTWSFATGGWSGNEDLIGALQKNRVFWALCWQSSHRGGLHTFRLPH